MTNVMTKQMMKDAYKGDAKSYYNLALVLQNQPRPDQVLIQAQLRKSANGGYVKAIRRLAELGLLGELVTSNSVVNRIYYYPDLNKAMSWISKGILAGDAACLYMRGKCYEYGIGLRQDAAHAMQDIEKAVEALSEDEILRLNILFLNVTKVHNIANDFPLKAS